MKKTIFFLSFIILILQSSQALSFPSYDFTFFRTTDETLTSFNRNNVGLDITGYGFVGEESSRGIYLRLGIQTPLKTLLKMKDDFLSALFPGNTEKNGSATTLSPAGSENTQESAETAKTDNSGKTGEDSASEKASGSPIISEKTGDESGIYSQTGTSDINTTSTTEWRFLFSLGPAYRKIMTEKAQVYAGLGVTLETNYVNIFTSSTGDIFSSFYAEGALDMDIGFRVGLENSRTTIRIGFHAITDIIGFYSYEMYNTQNAGEREKFYDIYGYIAGKDGITGATTAWGYIRLATTFTSRSRMKYNYSNRTLKTGGGTVSYIE